MRGAELAKLRKEMGFTQSDLMEELGVASRQTISSWEKPGRDVPRLVELAVIALRDVPKCRIRYGKKATRREQREFRARGRS